MKKRRGPGGRQTRGDARAMPRKKKNFTAVALFFCDLVEWSEVAGLMRGARRAGAGQGAAGRRGPRTRGKAGGESGGAKKTSRSLIFFHPARTSVEAFSQSVSFFQTHGARRTRLGTPLVPCARSHGSLRVRSRLQRRGPGASPCSAVAPGTNRGPPFFVSAFPPRKHEARPRRRRRWPFQARGRVSEGVGERAAGGRGRRARAGVPERLEKLGGGDLGRSPPAPPPPCSRPARPGCCHAVGPCRRAKEGGCRPQSAAVARPGKKTGGIGGTVSPFFSPSSFPTAAPPLQVVVSPPTML